jgi:V/A-type H+-transporting ATPase subunit C
VQSVYGLPYGTLKVQKTQFLHRSDYENMLRLSSISDFINFLNDRGYREDFSAYSQTYQGLELLEAANNRHLARQNRFALTVTPQNGKDLIVSYLTKWDIQNLKTIMVSKNLNYKVEQTEMYLVSENNQPLGLFAGLMDSNDYKNLLGMDRIEDIVSYTLKFGYGKALLTYLDDFRKSNNLSSLLLSLDLYYYDLMKEKFRFYTGSEGPIYRFIRKTIDIKNIMTILRFLEYSMEQDPKDYILSGGSLPSQVMDDISKSQSVEEVTQKLKSYFDLTKGLDFYKRRGSLVGIEGELNRNIYWEFLEIFEMSSLSLNNIMAFLMRVEAEWKDVRTIAMSKFYGIDEETIKMISINLG